MADTQFTPNDRTRLLTGLASIEIKFAALPISRHDPIVGSVHVVAPQQLIDSTATLEGVAKRAAREFYAELLIRLKATEHVHVGARTPKQGARRG